MPKNAIHKDTIKKSHISAAVAKKLGIPDTHAKEAVQEVLDFMRSEIEKGNRIELRGFGCFGIYKRSPRESLNPKTLEKVQVPAKKVVRFKQSKLLKIN